MKKNKKYMVEKMECGQEIITWLHPRAGEDVRYYGYYDNQGLLKKVEKCTACEVELIFYKLDIDWDLFDDTNKNPAQK